MARLDKPKLKRPPWRLLHMTDEEEERKRDEKKRRKKLRDYRRTKRSTTRKR